jgi:hypothetical protein
MKDIFTTNAITNLFLIDTQLDDDIEEMPNLAPYPFTLNKNSYNALRKLFNTLCGSMEEILDFDIESVAENSKYGISKMLVFMIKNIQRFNSRNKSEKLLHKINMEYVNSCRKVAVFIISNYCNSYSEYEYEYYEEIIPIEILDNIMYILKVAYGDINICDVDIDVLIKDVEILMCNNIDYQKKVMQTIRSQCRINPDSNEE